MIFHPTPLAGMIEIEPERNADQRGFFARTWCMREFAENGIAADFVQCGTSYNRRCGTVRGLHYQAAPFSEAKLVRCTRGRLWDVAVDLRETSPTWGNWSASELSAENGRLMFIPEGVAHGFQTLEDDTEVFYQMTAEYRPEAARGVRWDDPNLAIAWPLGAPSMMSEGDRNLPLLRDACQDIEAAVAKALSTGAVPC